jgi:MFS family permease
MNLNERKMAFSIALVFGLRMLGLFMILPIIGFYTETIPGATPALVGWAVGIYGLAQAVCQTLFGWLSDKFGRKTLILVGLALFILGSLMAAFSSSIWGLIFARAIQGMGAIGAVLLAWLSDTTRSEVRTQAMAIVGMTIGASFGFAFILGPVLDAYVGLNGLFLLTAILGILAFWWVKKLQEPQESETYSRIKSLDNLLTPSLATWGLLKSIAGFAFGVFALHALFTASFLFIPECVVTIAGISQSQTWMVYLPAFLFSFLVVFPLARKTGNQSLVFTKRLMQLAIVTLSLSLAYLLWPASLHQLSFAGLFIAMILFFSAFNFLEAFMPSLLSRLAPSKQKGMALGAYSTAQFLGIFFGGAVGGLFKQYFTEMSMVFFVLGLGSLWLLITVFLFYQKRSALWLEG